jgi:hypothetical protein
MRDRGWVFLMAGQKVRLGRRKRITLRRELEMRVEASTYYFTRAGPWKREASHLALAGWSKEADMAFHLCGRLRYTARAVSERNI